MLTVNEKDRLFYYVDIANIKNRKGETVEVKPCAYRITCEVTPDTGFILNEDKALFFSKNEAEKYIGNLGRGAIRNAGAKKFTATLTALYRDPETGRILPGYKVPDMTYTVRA